MLNQTLVRALLPYLPKNADRAAILLEELELLFKTEEAYVYEDMDGKKWIFKSYDNFCKFLPTVSSNTIGAIVRKLEESGVIISARSNEIQWKRHSHATHPYNRIKWYFFDKERFDELIKAQEEKDLPVKRKEESFYEREKNERQFREAMYGRN